MYRKIDQLEFEFVSDIIPFLDEDGYPIEFYLTDDEKLKKEIGKTYADTPFCNFRIKPGQWAGKKGILAVALDDEIVYIDECENLKYRINNQYGTVNKTLWIKQYYSKFAHVNSRILSEYKKGKKIKLYFYNTYEPDAHVDNLVESIDPFWNKKPSRSIENASEQVKKSEFEEISRLRRGAGASLRKENYQQLENYLRNVSKDELELSFKEIEDILGASLPASAYNFRTWWQYGAKYHKAYWRNAGYKVKKVKLGEYAIFEKMKTD